MLLMSVIVIAVLGSWTPAAPAAAETCQQRVCLSNGAGDATTHDSPSHDPCLHDHACGGGAALGLAGALLGVVPAAIVLRPRQQVAATMAPCRPTTATATLVGGVERPPRAPR